MCRKAVILSLCAVVLCCLQPARAAAVELSVTIKSVDVKAREITVTYETKAWQKTIQLVVGPNAELKVNGRPGTLDLLKPGQKATVSFDKELLVADKIEVEETGRVATDTASRREVYRLTLKLSEFGDGQFRMEKTSQPPTNEFSGTPITLSNWPRTKVTKGQNGMFRLVHDFSDADDLGVLAFEKHNLTIDKDMGLAVFTPGPNSEGSSFPRGARFVYAKKLRLPVTVVCDLVQYGGGHFAIHLSDRKLGMLQCRLWSKEPNLDRPLDFVVDWHEYDENGKRNATTLCDTKGVTLEQPFEKHFRLPLPNATITQSFLFDLSKAMGDEPTTVSRLEVCGRLVPMFGLDLKEAQGNVFAKTVNLKGLAEKAGFQSGDVISAINGKRPRTVAEAVDMLGHISIGDEVVFTIQRAEKNQELRVIAE